MTFSSILPYIQILIAVILATAILLQRSSAGLGGAFGDSSNFSSTFHSRRGPEKFLFYASIILAVLLALSSLAALLIR